jgi:hypothetical protein
VHHRLRGNNTTTYTDDRGGNLATAMVRPRSRLCLDRRQTGQWAKNGVTSHLATTRPERINFLHEKRHHSGFGWRSNLRNSCGIGAAPPGNRPNVPPYPRNLSAGRIYCIRHAEGFRQGNETKLTQSDLITTKSSKRFCGPTSLTIPALFIGFGLYDRLLGGYLTSKQSGQCLLSSNLRIGDNPPGANSSLANVRRIA